MRRAAQFIRIPSANSGLSVRLTKEPIPRLSLDGDTQKKNRLHPRRRNSFYREKKNETGQSKSSGGSENAFGTTAAMFYVA